MTVLDVVQRLAILVRGSDGVALIDAGPPDGSSLRALPRGTTRTIDALMVTYTDLDHARGATDVQRRLRVRRTLGAHPRAEPLRAGDHLDLGPETSVEVMAPPAAGFVEHASENDGSLLLLVALGERRVLLTADIEANAERWLLGAGRLGPADALVVPHHGSRTASTKNSIEAVRPSIAVVWAGAGNQFGHHNPQVVARYEALWTRVLNTAKHGSVTLRLRAGNLEVRTAR